MSSSLLTSQRALATDGYDFTTLSSSPHGGPGSREKTLIWLSPFLPFTVSGPHACTVLPVIRTGCSYSVNPLCKLVHTYLEERPIGLPGNSNRVKLTRKIVIVSQTVEPITSLKRKLKGEGPAQVSH